MSVVLISEAAPGTPEWHEVRANGIGASEIAAVVGLSPWESPFSLWHRKKGNLPPQPQSDLFYWGHALEPLVAQRFAELHPEYAVETCGTFANVERPWQFANLDRVLIPVKSGPFAVLEIKTTRYGDGWGPAGSDDIPLHVRCQVIHQMDVFGYGYAWVAVLIGGSDYREYRIEYDEAEAAILRDAGEAFWLSIQSDDEPPIDVTDSTYQAIRALHPDIDDADVELDPSLYIEYATSKAAADATADDHRKVKSEVLHVMGNARRALVDGSPVLRRQPTRNGAVALYPVKEKS